MRRLLTLIGIFSLLILSAVPIMAQDSGDAHLRVAHLSTNAGAVDVYVNGDAALENVDFGVVSDWMLVPPGTYSIAVAPAGTSIDDAVLGPLDVTAEANSWYTIAAIGLVDSEFTPLTAQVIEEDYSDIALGQTRVTIFHAIPNAAPVSVVAGDNVLVAGLAFPGTQGDNDGATTLDFDAGTYDIEVRLTDTPDTVVLDLPGTELNAERNIFIAAAGLAEDPTLVFVSTNPAEVDAEMMAGDETAGGDVHLRVAHFSEDAPAVDVYINGALSDFAGVEFPAISSWTTVPAGTYSVAVAPAGTSIEEAVIGPVDVTLSGGEWYTVAAVGLVGDGSLTAQVLEEDYSDIPAGQTRFTVFHASPGAPPVDVLVNGEPFVQTLAFPGTQGNNDGAETFTVLAGAYDIAVTANEDPDTVLLSAEGFNMEAGSYYFIAAVNTVDDLDLFVQTLSAEEIANAR